MSDEIDFTHMVLLRIGADPHFRVWRQNAGKIPVRDRAGKVVRVFHAAPTGAADISGVVMRSGRRLEIELKMPKKKRSKEQIAWAELMLAAGALYQLYEYDEAKTEDENAQLVQDAVLEAIRCARG
jgi:hypothetical protein